MILTESTTQAHHCPVAGILATELGNSKTGSGRKPAFMSAAFFVSVAHFTLWWIVRGGASLLGSSGSSFPTSHGLPPVIGNPVGRYILPEGAIIMANTTVQNSPENQAKYTFLDSVDKLDEVRSRLSFIQDALSQSTDWIDASAAEGLFFTLKSIMDDVEDVSKSVHSNLKALPLGGAA